MVRFLATAGGMTPAQVNALIRDAVAPVQEMAQAARNQALGAEARAEAAEALGQQAHTALATTTAEIDTRYDTLEELAASYAQALPASVADRAALHAQLDALTARVSVLEAAKVQVAYGNATLTGSLLSGASTNVVVTLSRNMGATYALGYGLAGGSSILGALVIGGVAAQTPTTVTLTVRNTGLTTLANLAGAVVHVVAAREG